MAKRLNEFLKHGPLSVEGNPVLVKDIQEVAEDFDGLDDYPDNSRSGIVQELDFN